MVKNHKQLYRLAKRIKQEFGRERVEDHSRDPPIELLKSKIPKIQPDLNLKFKRGYVRRSAEIYHRLRTSNKTASSEKIARFATYFVMVNDPNLDIGGDGTVCFK